MFTSSLASVPHRAARKALVIMSLTALTATGCTASSFEKVDTLIMEAKDGAIVILSNNNVPYVALVEMTLAIAQTAFAGQSEL